MSDCCTTKGNDQQTPKRHTCPQCSKLYGEVPFKTILHHIKSPWDLPLKEQAYYFCNDPLCDVVYYGIDNSTIHKDLLRTKVGIKETSDDTLICYCFGVSKSEARDNSIAKAFVVKQTKNSLCSCATHNPSGRCCLKDFPNNT